MNVGVKLLYCCGIDLKPGDGDQGGGPVNV